MEDLSLSTGRSVILQWNGKEYLLDGFCFKDRQVMQAELMRLKRRKITLPVVELYNDLPREEWQRQFDRARDAAGGIEDLAGGEVEAYLESEEGMSSFLFVLMERRYPGSFNREELLQMIISGSISEEQISEIMQAIGEAMETVKNSRRRNQAHQPLSIPATQEATTG